MASAAPPGGRGDVLGVGSGYSAASSSTAPVCPSSSAAKGSPAFAVFCRGHDGQRNHIEYIFRVRHSSGFEWTVRRRYQDLLELHERLSAVFGAAGLPTFPPRMESAGSVVGALFGTPVGSRPEVVAQRERLFQKYFDELCSREDVARTPLFQGALAVQQPEPVAHLRVRGWLPAASAGQGATVLLDIRPERSAAESSGIAEAYYVVARLIFRDPVSDVEELCLVAEVVSEPVAAQAAGGDTLARVPDLKPGAQVDIEVVAQNAIGRSSPVSIRLLVPEASAPVVVAEPAMALATPAEAPTVCQTVSAGDAMSHEPSTISDDLAREALALEQRRLDLERRERRMSERQIEAERADAERERQMEKLEREKSELEAIRHPPATSWEASPPESPRDREHAREALDAALGCVRVEQEEWEIQWQEMRAVREEAQEAQAREVELEKRVDELRTRAAKHEAAMEKSEERQRAKQAELEREREELRHEHEEQQLVADLAEAACQARFTALEEEQELLEQQRLKVGADSVVSEQAMLKAQQDQLYREREKEAADRKAQVRHFEHAEAELLRRAEQLSRTEMTLRHEREHLASSRRNLAVVQAHVFAKLDEMNPGVVKQHRMDCEATVDGVAVEHVGKVDGDDNDDVPGMGDRVWSMDWTAVNAKTPRSPRPDDTPP